VKESEVIERAEALPDLFAGRIRPEDLDGLRSMARAGEWRELVGLLVASLGSTGVPVTAGERGELRSLLAAMDMPDASLAGLTVAPLPATVGEELQVAADVGGQPGPRRTGPDDPRPHEGGAPLGHVPERLAHQRVPGLEVIGDQPGAAQPRVLDDPAAIAVASSAKKTLYRT
jgi:hypothetical protein